MKYLMLMALSLFATSAFALDDYTFKCDMGSFTIAAQPGVKKASESPVVGLNIKVLKQQVPLFLIKATTSTGEKNLFVTDWTPKSNVSEEGTELLDLLGFFYDIDVDTMESLRAGIPTDLLDTFAYLEVKDKSGKITKLGFEGSNPSECQ